MDKHGVYVEMNIHTRKNVSELHILTLLAEAFEL